MSLLDDLVDIESRRTTYPGPQCTVTRILAQLSESDREQLVKVLDDPLIPGAAIAEALTRNGFRVTDKTVRRHRRRGDASGCNCPKDAA